MAAELLEVLERDKKARRRLLKLLAGDLIESPELRYTVLETIGAEIATKQDIKEVKAEIKETEERIKGYVDARIGDLSRTVQVGFTALGIMIAGFALLVAILK